MASPQPEGGRRPSAWPTALVSMAVGTAFLALWFWLLPPWLGFHSGPPFEWWRWLGMVPVFLGFAVALLCMWDFGWTGGGTPAPLAPPKRLVVVGPYQYVRNPMYLGFFVGWMGLWVLFGEASASAAAVAGVAVLGTALFVRLYEEPTLREKFGEDYVDYCTHVRRWVPRLRAWQRPGTR
jgi:protein-S-isoprenylcysteine O-methyltransferase Ste14